MNNQLVFIPELIGVWNLEFVYSPQDGFFSKILYKSFFPHAQFCWEIYNYIDKNISLWDSQREKIRQIFSLWKSYDCVFHFWTDQSTQRYKFYISLYDKNFQTALYIISVVKTILWISPKYYLEKDFLKFDCLWFDIQNGLISLKIYELTSSFSPQLLSLYTIKSYIREQWVLKDFSGRKKYFYRFSQPIDISFFSKNIILPEIHDSHNYSMSWKVRYFCEEGERQEYYFW